MEIRQLRADDHQQIISVVDDLSNFLLLIFIVRLPANDKNEQR